MAIIEKLAVRVGWILASVAVVMCCVPLTVLAAEQNRVVVCDDCSLEEARRKAIGMTQQGTVYVLDYVNASVRAFVISTEQVSSNPFTLKTTVETEKPDEQIEAAFKGFIRSVDAIPGTKVKGTPSTN
ncbi:hypothetical protein F3N42_03580 [Marinihelvus fidelis]|uniref:Uncharacterized protein n=1 Tax=Marinihelvus fidelis TaxID=2613842 RepID=A0A5N0TEB9_9GAMM|nr:hypothetical protein [Marinihelvus fidelis]KAA9133443.1 hypothetical protein F3N42_03580 [Marinihelvus fidelis]